jgi:hypothetical protein
MFPNKIRCENEKVIFGERKISILIKENIIRTIPEEASKLSDLIKHYKNTRRQIKLDLKEAKKNKPSSLKRLGATDEPKRKRKKKDDGNSSYSDSEKSTGSPRNCSESALKPYLL